MSHHGDHTVYREHVLQETVDVLRSEREHDRRRIHELEVQRANLASQCVMLRIELREATGLGNVEVDEAALLEPRPLVDHVWPAPAPGAEPVLGEWIDGPGATLDDAYEILPGYAATDD